MGKKNDILRVRVDATLLNAVQRCSEQSNLSLSEFLRQGIIHELASRQCQAPGAGTGVDPPPATAGHRESDDRRRHCAELLALMLLGGRGTDPGQRRNAGCRAANLIEAILRILASTAETDDRSSCTENFPAAMVAAGPRHVHDGPAASQAEQPLRRNAG